MSMDHFVRYRAPSETLLEILGAGFDSVEDVISFVLCSRPLYEFWKANEASLRWRIWLRVLPDFEYAIIAVSARCLVSISPYRHGLPMQRI
jgi:hypothetical protein